MQTLDHFEATIRKITRRDSRYAPGAFLFIREALAYTQKNLSSKRGQSRPEHFTGQDFLGEVRDYVVKVYGPLGFYVLSEWGIHCCEDIGAIVYLMVDANLISKSEGDSRNDFSAIYDFREAFVWPFLPPSMLPGRGRGGRARNVRARS